MRGQVATMHTYCVHLGHILCDSQQIRYRAKRFAPVIHIQPGYHHPDASQGKLLANLRQIHIKKLGFIHTNHGSLRAYFQQPGGAVNRRSQYGGSVVRYNIGIVVAGIYLGFEYLHFQVGYRGSLQPPDQFFRFSGKHAAADHFDPPGALAFKMRFEKHFYTGEMNALQGVANIFFLSGMPDCSRYFLKFAGQNLLLQFLLTRIRNIPLSPL